MVKCLAQGHKCHGRDSNPHSAANTRTESGTELDRSATTLHNRRIIGLRVLTCSSGMFHRQVYRESYLPPQHHHVWGFPNTLLWGTAIMRSSQMEDDYPNHADPYEDQSSVRRW